MVIAREGGSNLPHVLINNLDASNPLHVQTNDNSNTMIPFKLLGTENYRIWSSAMKLVLQARNKIGFIDGTCLKDPYVNSDVLSALVQKKTNQAFGVLRGLVSITSHKRTR